MKRSEFFGVITFAVLVTAIAGGPAHAGGISLYEFGSPDVGLAAAGYAAAHRMPRRCSPTRPG